MQIRRKYKYIRLLKFFYIKVLRSKGTPHTAALAIAIGLFVGCLLPIGTQTIPAILLAFIFRTDKLLAFIGTLITNPYTVVFLYPIFCFIGSLLLGSHLTFAYIEKATIGIIHSFSWDALLGLGEELVISYFIGGFIFGVVSGVAGYLITYSLVYKYKKMKFLKKPIS